MGAGTQAEQQSAWGTNSKCILLPHMFPGNTHSSAIAFMYWLAMVVYLFKLLPPQHVNLT